MAKKKQQKSNNALSLGRMINNAQENIEEAEISMELAATPEERENLEEKNARRKSSIYQMEKQLKEEGKMVARKNNFK